MKKLKVCVLMGGRSPEYEISLLSGREVVKHLEPKKYKVTPLVINRDDRNLNLRKIQKIFSDSPGGGVVFIAMHGPYGEDGTIQGLFELTGIPYTGSGVLASALGMNKIMFRKVMEREKVSVPKYLVFWENDSPTWVWKFFNKPSVFVKPYNQSSSVGASLVHKKSESLAALKLAFSYSNPVLVEEYLAGIEVSCGVLGNENPQALPVAEIIPKNDFFDYEAKYTPGKSKEIVPARLSKFLTKKVQETAVRVFQAIGARGFARVDMIIKNGRPIVLEINTIPGLTFVSVLPKEAAATGISYPELLNKIINLALEDQ